MLSTAEGGHSELTDYISVGVAEQDRACPGAMLQGPICNFSRFRQLNIL